MGFLDVVSDIATGVGTAFGIDQLIGKPAAEDAFAMTQEGQMQQFLLEQQAAQQAYQNSVYSSATAWQRDQEAAQRAYDMSLRAYGDRYKMTMADMQQAGLNPILAASQGGFQVGNAITAHMGRANPAQSPKANASSAQGFLRHLPKDYVTEGAQRRSQTKLNKQKALQSIAETQRARAQAGLMTKQEAETATRIFKLEHEQDKIRAEITEIDARRQLLQKQTEVQQAERTRIEAMTNQIKAQKTLLYNTSRKLEAELVKLQKIADVYDGPAGNLLIELREILRSGTGR